ncbi:LacI family DNA-binding transcriptional regulator [Sulfitobacter sp. HNIBRBA2951]|uniref:LacI family DNA-binding transcriptional regulator n=1 Tax=Sulfitobacter aquimarinus TaxID=3158557 RepID=UPI0032DEDB36
MTKTRSSRPIPTLDDVARKAGVSTATVSRCINTPDRVVEATRAKVTKAIESLGYTPNFGARVMAAKRTFTIGAIVPTMENSIFARGLQAFQEQLHSHGYTLLVSSSAYDPKIEEEQVRALVARGADGLMLIGYDRDAAIYKYLERQSVPALIAWAYAPQTPRPAIGFDNRAAMAMIADAVLAQGHRHIAVISAHVKGNDRAAERVEGIRASLHTRDLQPEHIIETSYDVDAGAQAMTELMHKTPRPTAVICGNDVLAAGALRAARDMGLEVPKDVSLTGFDDMDLAQVVTPALTTMHVPHREMGRIGADMLIAMVEGAAPPAPVQLPTTLQRRASLGPAPTRTPV